VDIKLTKAHYHLCGLQESLRCDVEPEAQDFLLALRLHHWAIRHSRSSSLVAQLSDG